MINIPEDKIIQVSYLKHNIDKVDKQIKNDGVVFLSYFGKVDTVLMSFEYYKELMDYLGRSYG